MSEKKVKPKKKYSSKCYFCFNEEDVSYKDVNQLKRCSNERGMIVPRQKTRLCAYHQRKLSSAIKKARLLALLPVGGRKNI